MLKGWLGRGEARRRGLEDVDQIEDSNDSECDGDQSGRYQTELQLKNQQIKELKQQLLERDERIAFLQALLHRSHLSESMSDLSKGLTHRTKDLDTYVINAVAYSEALEEKIASLNKKNRALKRKLSQQTSREQEILILRQILSVEEQIDSSHEDEIEYLQSLTRRQYEYATRQKNPLAVGSGELETEGKGREEGDRRETWHRKKGSSSASHSQILDEVRNVLDNLGV
jgi:hypothetical protein